MLVVVVMIIISQIVLYFFKQQITSPRERKEKSWQSLGKKFTYVL